jgi:protein TonB
LSGSVPISIVAHLVLLLVLVVIPLANIVLPIPFRSVESFMLAAPLPPPPENVPRPPSSVAPSPAPTNTVAPTFAPKTIEPEAPAAPPSIPIGNAPEGGVPSFGVVGSVGLVEPVPPPAPEPPKAQGPVRVAMLPEAPRKLFDVHPVYPEIARAAHVEGTVILEAMLDTNGRVTQLKVLRSVSLLDQAALDAVRQWRYSPSIYYGRPVSVLMTVTVRFTLQQ